MRWMTRRAMSAGPYPRGPSLPPATMHSSQGRAPMSFANLPRPPPPMAMQQPPMGGYGVLPPPPHMAGACQLCSPFIHRVVPNPLFIS